jgi:ParB family transcriptional regulator, chromosome partitioning protein
MTSKIKKFQGSLKPVFDASISHQIFEQETSENSQKIRSNLPINSIKPRQDQPRKQFDETSLNELAQSIVAKGVIQPIIVRPTHNGHYEIIVGERRWRASKQAGLDEIPAIVRNYSKSDGMAVSLIENIQRDNLNPLEEAQAIHDLLEECSMTHLQIAENIGKSRAVVSNLLRLLNLEFEVQVMVRASLLEMGHARALLSLSGQAQIDAAKLVVEKSLSVREIEKLVQKGLYPTANKTLKIDPEFSEKTRQWKSHMSKNLCSEVNVHFGKEGKGRVVIHFNSLEEADWLIDHLDIKQKHG